MRKSLESVWKKGTLPWYIKTAWHMRLLKFTKDDVVSTPSDWERDAVREYMGYSETQMERYHPKTVMKGWTIKIPF